MQTAGIEESVASRAEGKEIHYDQRNLKSHYLRTPLVDQLRLHDPNAVGVGLIPGGGAKDPPCHTCTQPKKKIWVTQRTQGAVRPLRRASNPDWMLKFLEKETSQPELKTLVRVLSTVSLKGLFK